MALFPLRVRRTGRILGFVLLVLAVLLHVPLLAVHAQNGQQWTAAMLDLMMASGALIVARTMPSFRVVQPVE